MSPGTVQSSTIDTHLFTLASHSTAHSPTETTATRRAQNSPPETTSSGSCMVGTGARAPHTMRTTATALCLSVAEYCCPVWARSTHPKLVDTTLNETSRLITGCIRPTATPDLYVLSSIAPPEIRRSVHCQNERTKQLTDQRHSLHHHQPVKSRLHSRNSFVSTSQPLLCKPAEARVMKWQNQWDATQSNLKKYDIHPKEQLPSGDTLPWRTWRTANRVRSGQAATQQRNICGATVRTNTVCAAQPHAI